MKQKNKNEERTWLRLNEASEYLQISTSQIHKLKNEGFLPFYKLGGTIYFKIEEIDTTIENNKYGGLYEFSS